MGQVAVETSGGRFEEVYSGHVIYIEPSPDQYRGGYEWSVCKDDVELDRGLEFSIEEAIKSARNGVDAIGVNET